MAANHRITAFVLTCLLAPSALAATTIEPLVRIVGLDPRFFASGGLQLIRDDFNHL